MENFLSGLSSSGIGSFLPIIILLALMYLLILRPSMKRNKETQNYVDTMEVGDEVMTAGGFYGLVYAIDDENVVLEMLPDYNKLMIRKSSIVKFITAEAAAAEVSGKSGKKGLFGAKKAAPQVEAPEVEEEIEAEVAEEVEEA